MRNRRARTAPRRRGDRPRQLHRDAVTACLASRGDSAVLPDLPQSTRVAGLAGLLLARVAGLGTPPIEKRSGTRLWVGRWGRRDPTGTVGRQVCNLLVAGPPPQVAKVGFKPNFPRLLVAREGTRRKTGLPPIRNAKGSPEKKIRHPNGVAMGIASPDPFPVCSLPPRPISGMVRELESVSGARAAKRFVARA